MRRAFWVIAAAIAIRSTAGAEPVAIPQQAAPLVDPNMVLSPSCRDFQRQDRPIVCYRNYGTEVVLPGAGLFFPPDQAEQVLKIGTDALRFRRADGRIVCSMNGKEAELRPSGLGFSPLDFTIAGGRSCAVAFPRGFFHGGAARLFYRAGFARVGDLEQERICLYDDNLDGQYKQGEDAYSIGDFTNVVVMAPIRELMPTAAAVRRVERLAGDGSVLELAPYAGATGTLRIEAASRDLQYRLVFASDDGRCAFPAVAGAAALALPAGEYRFLYGLIRRTRGGATAAIVLPGAAPAVTIAGNAQVAITLGQTPALRGGGGGEIPSVPFEALLELDLSGVEETCRGGDFAKAQQELAAIVGKAQSGPNFLATRRWMEDLGGRLALETTPEAAALRQAEEQVLAAVKQGDRAGARARLDAVRAAMAKVPASFADTRALRWHKARAEALARYADGVLPGLKVTFLGHGMRGVTGTEVVPTVDWSDSPGGNRTQFFGCRYEGFLAVPEDGEYELALESDEGARLEVDGKLVIDHWRAHTLAEKSMRLTLAAGAHPLKIEHFQGLGGAGLHFRWVPPGGRKTVVPDWALEHTP